MKRLPKWPPKSANLPSLAVLERLSIETDPPASPKPLLTYRPCPWEIGGSPPRSTGPSGIFKARGVPAQVALARYSPSVPWS
jgi:hypothetical protein